jgi:hypothetical protein
MHNANVAKLLASAAACPTTCFLGTTAAITNIVFIVRSQSRRLGFDGLCRRVETLPHGRPHAGKNSTPVPADQHAGGQIVGKIHPLRLHIAQGDVELLNLPSRPTGTSATPPESRHLMSESDNQTVRPKQ